MDIDAATKEVINEMQQSAARFMETHAGSKFGAYRFLANRMRLVNKELLNMQSEIAYQEQVKRTMEGAR